MIRQVTYWGAVRDLNIHTTLQKLRSPSLVRRILQGETVYDAVGTAYFLAHCGPSGDKS